MSDNNGIAISGRTANPTTFPMSLVEGACTALCLGADGPADVGLLKLAGLEAITVVLKSQDRLAALQAEYGADVAVIAEDPLQAIQKFERLHRLFEIVVVNPDTGVVPQYLAALPKLIDITDRVLVVYVVADLLAEMGISLDDDPGAVLLARAGIENARSAGHVVRNRQYRGGSYWLVFRKT